MNSTMPIPCLGRGQCCDKATVAITLQHKEQALCSARMPSIPLGTGVHGEGGRKTSPDSPALLPAQAASSLRVCIRIQLSTAPFPGGGELPCSVPCPCPCWLTSMMSLITGVHRDSW